MPIIILTCDADNMRLHFSMKLDYIAKFDDDTSRKLKKSEVS